MRIKFPQISQDQGSMPSNERAVSAGEVSSTRRSTAFSKAGAALARIAVLGPFAAFLLLSGPLSNATFGAEPPATRHPVMQLSSERKQQLLAAHMVARRLSAPKGLEGSFPTSVNLLSRLPYVPVERDQGACGDCWQWAATGVMEIAHNVQDGVQDRLSVQFINSCNSSRSCCEGGWLEDFTSFYGQQGFTVPWENNNAQFSSGDGTCGSGSCGTIATSPQYPIASISTVTIPTFGVGQAQAIANIKTALNQNKAIWFGFFMPQTADWNQFFSFWDYQPETAVWTNFYCGQTWSGGGGHTVLCVGYDDTDPSQRYWIMVNSWGTARGMRLNGIFRVSMDLDYDCADANGYNCLYWKTIDVQFVAAASGAPVLNSEPPVTPGTGNTISWSPAFSQNSTNTMSANAKPPAASAKEGAAKRAQVLEPTVEYYAECADNSAFASPLSSGWITQQQWSFNDLTPGQAYWFRVKARLGGQESGWSNAEQSQQEPMPSIVLAASPSDGGTVGGSGVFPVGSVLTVTATASPGYRFVSWTESEVVVNSSANYSFTLTSNRNLVANFSRRPATYTIAPSSSPSAGGRTTGGGAFLPGSRRTVTASASQGYQFVNWTENGNVVSSTASYTFTLNANRSLVANFTARPVNYTIRANPAPSVGGRTTGSGSVPSGSARTVTATANSGYRFVNWTENRVVVSSSAAYAFTVNGNHLLAANFVRAAGVVAQASYLGLFYETNQITHQTSGWFTIAATSSGGFSGTLQSGGVRYAISGHFNENGTAQVVIPRTNQAPLTVALNVESVEAETLSGSVSDGNWTATLLGDRAENAFGIKGAPQVARYAFELRTKPGATAELSAESFGTVTVDESGRATLSAILPDGTKVSCGGALGKQGDLAVYVPLYQGQGSILGWIHIPTNEKSALTGQVSWIKSSTSGVAQVADGFSVHLVAAGARSDATHGDGGLVGFK